ncbi:MAG: hypothetical protein D8M59_07900 [Planctomycetes bacterium]|nr:hypothetical protein [Planctomycetota bacterium]
MEFGRIVQSVVRRSYGCSLPFACIGVCLIQGCTTVPHDARDPVAGPSSVGIDSDVSLSAACLFETYSPTSPVLVFASDRLNEQISIAGQVAGFGRDDWEFGRNDSRLGAGRPVMFPAEQWAYVEHLERVYDTDGRIRTLGHSRISSGTGWLPRR